jgi:NADPH-dependent 2,4-dienoyl-CoA reductase/sulfur reductase-like enzyme
VPLAEAIKRVVTVPVITVGKIGDPALAEEVLREGKADFVAMARALFADPELPRKAAEGRLDEIVRCLYCNNCRLPADGSDLMKSLGVRQVCTVNPAVLRESEFRSRRTKSPKKIMIVGGGLAGIQTALVAAERGHRVHLYERSGVLGGQWNIACLVEHKRHFGDFVLQLIDRLNESGAEVQLNKEVTAAFVRQEKPDAVVVATGASPKPLDVQGCGQQHVVQAVEVLAGSATVGERVVVVGGRLVGMEVADMLARKGKKVTLVTKHNLGENGRPLERNIFVTLRDRLVEAGVAIHSGSVLFEIGHKGVYIECDRELAYIEADTVVLAVGARANDELVEELKEMDIPVYVVGDCREPRDAKDAVSEGATVGLRI